MVQVLNMDSYFDPRHPASFSGSQNVHRHLDKKFTTKQIKDWLSKQDSYTLHKPVRRRFQRRKIYAKCIDDLWQADLADVTSLSKFNDNYKFLLTCIDVLSKFAWVIPLKNKTGKSITGAFSKIIVERQLIHLQTDEGSEFKNELFQSFLEDHKIKFYTSENNEIKAAVVERFNRTLKNKMYRYFTFKGSRRYVDVLTDLVHSYNHTFHTSIKMAPAEVTIQNESEVGRRLYPPKKKLKFKFNIGDKVRISEERKEFKKGYLASWSEEIFTIVTRNPSDPVTYEIADYSGEKIKGKLYELELQRIVKEDDVYKVEKVLKTRKRGSKKEYFVKWTGYPDSFNSWVTDLKVV